MVHVAELSVHLHQNKRDEETTQHEEHGNPQLPLGHDLVRALKEVTVVTVVVSGSGFGWPSGDDGVILIM